MYARSTASQQESTCCDAEVIWPSLLQRWGQDEGSKQAMVREPSLPPELEEDPQAAATQLWQEVHSRCVTVQVTVHVIVQVTVHITVHVTVQATV